MARPVHIAHLQCPTTDRKNAHRGGGGGGLRLGVAIYIYDASLSDLPYCSCTGARPHARGHMRAATGARPPARGHRISHT